MADHFSEPHETKVLPGLLGDASPAIVEPFPETLCNAPGQADLASPRLMPEAEQPHPAGGMSGYELLDVLGRGGMGVVYKARDARLNRLVALKMVLSGVHAGAGDLARFRAEAEAVARLQHPHIVQIYEIGAHEGRPFFAMELVDGPTLQHILAGTPQPARPAARLIEVVARAVHFAHQRGIVHRDLKPGNILLAPAVGGPSEADPGLDGIEALYGVPKVSDFGLAKRLGEEEGLTRSGDMLGTPSYMAPEQAAGNARKVGPGADVYALGATLYELLTGRPPFKGATALDTVWQVLNEEPVPPGSLRPRLPRDLERICLKCLEKDPARRYLSALDLADDLRRHLAGEAVLARPASPAERVWRWSRRNPIAASLFLAVTLGAASGLWYLSWLSRQLVESAAIESAAQQSLMLDEVNRYYAQIVGHVKMSGVQAHPDWLLNPGAVPLPATFTIELGNRISEAADGGVKVRLFSDHPFRARKDRPPPDEFQARALAELRERPEQPYYRFEEFDGVPSLRYATARRMQAACVECHNKHPDSLKNDWQVGDVRGALEIIRPLGRDAARIHQGLRSAFLLVAGIGMSLLLACGLALLWSKRRLAVLTSPNPRPPSAGDPLWPPTAKRTAAPLPEPTRPPAPRSARDLCEALAAEATEAKRAEAMLALRQADPALHEVATDLGPGRGTDRQLEALNQLALMKRKGEPAAPLVRALVARALAGPPTDSDVFTVNAALLALQEIAPHEAGTFQSFVRAASWPADGSSTCRQVRETALRLLAVQARECPAVRIHVASAVGPLVRDRSLGVAASATLAECGALAQSWLPELRRLLLSPSAYVRREAEKAIAAIEAAAGPKP